ncbi:unnamed protein product [Prorocentrum cordatum]|uniref:Pentacotripeptide-repeat region of PRORP domain-containing protein n=1 Tax=Prorocentrum cordatum TaxID=2364126 RepID=A0ABN9QZY9_9DINO|nr:unnamed protein product [Polarella glacialis]
MLPTMMLRTAQQGSAGRAARKDSMRTAVFGLAFAALSQVLLILARSVFDMRPMFELLPEVVVLVCFLISYSAGWMSKVRRVTTTKPMPDKVVSDADHTCPRPSGMRAIAGPRTEGVAPAAPNFRELMKLCVTQQQVEPALRMFNQMLEEGVGPDAHHIGKSVVDRFFNLVAENLSTGRLRRDGLSLFEMVEAHGLAPSTSIQNRLMVAWKSRPPKSVVSYLLRMRSAGMQLSRLSYFCIIISSERSDPVLVLKMCDEMQTLGIKPDKVAYNALLGACSHLGLCEEAGQLFDQMPNHGIIPDVKSYRIMISVNARNKKYKEAVALLETMRESGLKPDRHDYHNAIQSCISLQRIEHAVELYNDMVRADVVPSKRTVASLTTACQTPALSF